MKGTIRRGRSPPAVGCAHWGAGVPFKAWSPPTRIPLFLLVVGSWHAHGAAPLLIGWKLCSSSQPASSLFPLVKPGCSSSTGSRSYLPQGMSISASPSCCFPIEREACRSRRRPAHISPIGQKLSLVVQSSSPICWQRCHSGRGPRACPAHLRMARDAQRSAPLVKSPVTQARPYRFAPPSANPPTSPP